MAMSVRRLALPGLVAVLAVLAALPAPAPAATSLPVALVPAAAVEAPAAVERTCFARALVPGAAGADVRVLTVPATGVLNARLDGSAQGPDWDLAVFDAGGRMLGASAAFGANELVTTPVTAGDLVTVQACHREGDGPAPQLHVDDVVLSGAVPAPPKLSLVAIRFRGRRDLDRLLRLDIDLNETARGHRVFAVLHGARDARRLRRAGFSWRTKIADLRADDRRALVSGAAAASVGALPSGRTAYRTLPDYEMDMKALADAHPGLVRPVILPRKSVEGRTIAGLEIAENVGRSDDGRPVHVQMGLHHVREWPSGEVVAEFAIDLVNGYGKDAEITSQLQRVRTFLFPVINPDGLVASQAAGAQTTPSDDNSNATLALAAAGSGPYRRKNCAPAPGEEQLPCAMRSGVDLNRNYGAFWGGPGSDSSWSSQTFRGVRPFSEPEAQAVHEWSSAHQVMVVNSNHTFARDFLYQPGFNAKDEPGFPKGTKVPYGPQMIALSDAMGRAAGYVSMYSYSLYDVTGATEDWNYFAQGAFGYTTEIAYDNFHPNYQDGVVDEYLGTLDGPNNSRNDVLSPSQGLRRAMLLAGQAAADPANHSVITGSAPAGLTLRLTKDFQTTTSYVEGSADGAAILIPEHLETRLTVPASGRYTWHVNPSTRPLEILAGRTEAWTLSYLAADGAVLQSRQVTVAIGQVATADMSCDGSAAAPVTGVSRPKKPRLTVRSARSKPRRVTLTLRTTAPLVRVRATLRDRRGHVRAKGSRAKLRRTQRIVLRARRALRPGRYRIVVTARTPGGLRVTARRGLRLSAR